jgi:MerR family transcriptional regulator, light-induced transcriptional regulator
MPDSDTLAMPIGAVTQMTGISSHTLRKWESRYAAVAPVRTETGRRLYTQQQVRKLIRLRDLVRQGYQIGHLSTLSESELEALGDERPAPAVEPAAVARVTVVGEVLAAVLQSELSGRDATLVAAPAGSWLAAPEVPATGEKQALVVELPTLSEPAIDSLARLRREHFARVLVVYGFATRKNLARLADAGVVPLKAPVNASEVLRNLQVRAAPPTLDTLEQRAIPARRFSAQSIARLAAMSPKLECECPNHIAQLVLDISAFEQYSLECEQSDPKERALHGRLRSIAAHARALFEEAMANVAEHEGVDLEDF